MFNKIISTIKSNIQYIYPLKQINITIFQIVQQQRPTTMFLLRKYWNVNHGRGYFLQNDTLLRGWGGEQLKIILITILNSLQSQPL